MAIIISEFVGKLSKQLPTIKRLEKYEFLRTSLGVQKFYWGGIDTLSIGFVCEYSEDENRGAHPFVLYEINFDWDKELWKVESSYVKIEKPTLSRVYLSQLKKEALIGFDKALKAADIARSLEVKKKTNHGDLYLIHDLVLNTLKIGKSKNPQGRIGHLQLSTANKLSLLFTVKDRGVLEKEAHAMFSELRLASEWFKYDQSIIDYFSTLNNLKA